MRSEIPVALVLAALAATPASAQKAADNYDELYQRYLVSARSSGDGQPRPMSTGWMSGLTLDARARAVNDLVTIQVIESIVASGSADSSLSKDSSGSASVSKLFGLDSKLPSWLDPTNLATTASNTDFKGGGATSRTGELSARITARVVEVLPNGDLVLEGAREIDINGDRQIVVLTGVVRPVDVDRSNVVRSTDIGQFRIRYFGQGLIRDNLKPGWLIKILNKIF
ncbi:MAG: flagellar basal body L-ring protein FlgH [Vicinamibacterales bacterium]